MTKYEVTIENIKGLSKLDVTFDFSSKRLIVVTGRNGAGKTTLVKAFKLISDPQIYENTSNLNAIGPSSVVSFKFSSHTPFSYGYNPKFKVLDTRQKIPPKETVVSELPIPFGNRFKQFSLVAKHDSDLRANIASSSYRFANELFRFLSDVYHDEAKFTEISETIIGRNKFYFILLHNDYYIREDHFSSGEFFLIQLYRLITSGAELVIIDELDIALDASAQVHLFDAIQPLLDKYGTNLIVMSHSLAFMKTVRNNGLYYLEVDSGKSTLEQRSYGYIKSDLYGFKGRDRYILTEDETLLGFIEYVIMSSGIVPFFKYEIIPVGGQPQIDAVTSKNDEHEIFGPSDIVIVVIDKDISEQIKYKGDTKIYTSPVDDIELFIWQNREELLDGVTIDEFQPAKKDKDTAKTYWKKVIASKQRSREELYQMVIDKNPEETMVLKDMLRNHLCLN